MSIKSDEHYIKIAIDEAAKSAEPLPCGAVIVSASGEILAQEFNKQRSVPDATAHAEVCAIRSACLGLGTKNLSGTIIYGSCEPCMMCLAAIIWAKIDRVVYAVALSEATHGNENSIAITSQELIAKAPRKIILEGGILKDEAMQRLYQPVKLNE